MPTSRNRRTILPARWLQILLCCELRSERTTRFERVTIFILFINPTLQIQCFESDCTVVRNESSSLVLRHESSSDGIAIKSGSHHRHTGNRNRQMAVDRYLGPKKLLRGSRLKPECSRRCRYKFECRQFLNRCRDCQRPQPRFLLRAFSAIHEQLRGTHIHSDRAAGVALGCSAWSWELTLLRQSLCSRS